MNINVNTVIVIIIFTVYSRI